MQRLTRVDQASGAINNRRLVIQLLRDTGPMSRRQLAQQTGLSKSSLTYITRELMEHRVIRIVGKLDRPGAGKKQTLLEINPELGWVVGVGMEGDSASMVLLDAGGRVIDRDRVQIRERHELLPSILRSRVDAWLVRHGTLPGRMLGVGMGVSGVVDVQRGQVLKSTQLRIEGWVLRDALAEAFGVPAHIDNDSNLAMMAEVRLGNCSDYPTFIYLLMNAREQQDHYVIHSVGSSLMIGGQLHRGVHFGAGEVDMMIAPDGPEARVTPEQLLSLANPEGDFDASYHPVADYIVRPIVAIADLIDPSAVLVGGNLCLANRGMIRYLQDQVNRRIVHVPERQVLVRSSMFMDHGVSTGAAITALDSALLQVGEDIRAV